MDRTDGIRTCSITVHLKQTQQVSGGNVLFEACRVGTVNENDGCIVLNWNMGELTRSRSSVSAEAATKELSAMLYPDTGESENMTRTRSSTVSDIRSCQAVTDQNGICTFGGIESGAWLIHALDSSSYGKIEDALVAVPAYVEEQGVWSGPVYSQDVWMKAEVLEPEKAVIQPEPESGETDSPASQESVPAEDTPVPQTEQKQTELQTETQIKKQTPVTSITPQPSALPPAEGVTTKSSKVPQTEEVQTPKAQTTIEKTPSASHTQAVRTLDDSPVSGLIFLCLFSILAIILLLQTLRKRSFAMFCRKHKGIGMFMLLLSAGIFSVSGRSVLAAEAESSSWTADIGKENKIVFVNQSPDAPALTVRKEVLNAHNGSRAPAGDTFTFHLRLDQKKASGVKYRLFNEGGIELVPSGMGDGLIEIDKVDGVPAVLRTGRDGSFTLSAGQTAVFEDVSVGELWEVAESDASQYERVVPRAGDTVSGTIQTLGSSAEFVNRYTPDEEGGRTGSIEITKKILWPEDITLPDSGMFRIRVMLDGQPLAGANVELTSLYEQCALSDTKTDENGCFMLGGNQRALLSDLPAGSDAFVEEMDDEQDLFVPSGDIAWKGAVSSKQKVCITNRLASFVVAKTLKSGDQEQSFLFSLTGKDGEPEAGVQYYLADEDGVLKSSECSETDSEGKFRLHGGEKAVFVGLEEGSVYSVREEKAFGYRQVTPTDSAGYTNLRIGNGIQPLLFENEADTVNLSAPSAGGAGVFALLAAPVAGMVILSILMIRKKRRI